MIRVLIERWIREGMEHQVHLALRDLRRKVLDTPGYVSAETMRDADDPHHYAVLATWQSREDWEKWARSETREAARKALEPLLLRPELVTVYEPA